jgi:hypothetical protein
MKNLLYLLIAAFCGYIQASQAPTTRELEYTRAFEAESKPQTSSLANVKAMLRKARGATPRQTEYEEAYKKSSFDATPWAPKTVAPVANSSFTVPKRTWGDYFASFFKRPTVQQMKRELDYTQAYYPQAKPKPWHAWTDIKGTRGDELFETYYTGIKQEKDYAEQERIRAQKILEAAREAKDEASDYARSYLAPAFYDPIKAEYLQGKALRLEDEYNTMLNTQNLERLSKIEQDKRKALERARWEVDQEYHPAGFTRGTPSWWKEQ